MKSQEKKRIRKNAGQATLPRESVSEMRAVLKDYKLSFRAAPPVPPTPKKIHPRRALPPIPDDKSDSKSSD